MSKYENYIMEILKSAKIKFLKEKTFKDLKNGLYRFDFYLPDYNLFIEYDGIQHFEPVRFHGDNTEKNERAFKKIQEYDNIKNNYCKENKINLLRIPYWETKNIEKIINNCLQRLSEKGFAA